MDIPFTALLFEIRTMLFIFSGLLLAAVAMSLYMEKISLIEKLSALLSWGVAILKTRATPNDHRISPRIKSDEFVDLRIGAGDYIAKKAQLHDISANGACIHSSIKLVPRERILARFHSPHSGMVYRFAKVVWQKQSPSDFLYGLEFQNNTRPPFPSF